MKSVKGCCLKCGAKILEGRKALPNYKCLGYHQENGNVVLIAFCSSCSLEPSDYTAAFNALNEKEKIDSPIVGFEADHTHKVTRVNLVCSKCNKPIVSNYVYTLGEYSHERCGEPDYITKAKVATSKAVKPKAKITRSAKSETELPS